MLFNLYFSKKIKNLQFEKTKKPQDANYEYMYSSYTYYKL